MNYSKLKQILYKRIKTYWESTTVVWGSSNAVKPLNPLVVLRLGNVTRPFMPITFVVNGHKISAYPSKTTLEVNLFTKGRTDNSGYTENTAVNDLIAFSNFLDSEGTTQWCSQNNISITSLNGVMDLSEVVNDTSYQYRAIAQWTVDFMQYVAENEAVLDEDCLVFDENGDIIDLDPTKWQQTASGGGTKDLAASEVGYFDTVSEDIFTAERENPPFGGVNPPALE